METILTTFSKEEFKALLKQTLQEILEQSDQPQTKKLPEILNVEQAAELLHLKVNTLYEKTCRKTIPHLKRGNKLYFNRAELEAWIQDGKVKTFSETESDALTYLMSGNRSTGKKAA